MKNVIAMPYLYRAVPLRIIDPDTYDFRVDLGFKLGMEMRVRLMASSGPVDAYELDDPDPAKRAMAREGLSFVQLVMPLNKFVLLRTVPDKRQQDKHDSFGRYLALVTTEDITDLGDEMLARKLAFPWKP